MPNKVNYIIELFFGGWSTAYIITPFILGIVTFLVPIELNTNDKLYILIAILILTVAIKLIVQFYRFYMGYLHPIKVLRKVQGDGINENVGIIVLENPGYLRDNCLLTLYCRSSGAYQTICILKVLKSNIGEELEAIQLSPPEQKCNIDKYFNEHSRLTLLFATPFVNFEEFEKTQMMVSEDN